MNTFPYDSWEAAIEAADGSNGYFTWGPGSNTGSYVLAIAAIALVVAWMTWMVMNESRHLKDAAAGLNDKWGI